MSIRSLAVLVLVAMGQRAVAQGVELREADLVDRCFRVEVQMRLKGHVSFQQGGKTVQIPQEAQAKHVFQERILDASAGLVDRSARIYQEAQAVLTREKNKIELGFTPGHRMMVAMRYRDVPMVYSLKGPFTQQEMELSDHFDTLSLSGLAPGKEVKVGDTWKVANMVAQNLCDLEGLVGHDLTCKLTAVTNGVAIIAIEGDVQGIDLGAQVQSKITGSAQFDVAKKCVTALTWSNREVRGQSPVNPAVESEISVELRRTPIDEPSELSKFAVVPIDRSKEPPADKAQIAFSDGGKRLQLTHARDWVPVSESEKHIVFRLMDQGDFVGQVTLAPWEPVGKDGMMPFAQFEKLALATPDLEADVIVSRNESFALPGGMKGYRLAMAGKLGGVEVVKYFYLVTSPTGQQLLATFAMTPNQVQKLGTRDESLVRTVQFLK